MKRIILYLLTALTLCGCLPQKSPAPQPVTSDEGDDRIMLIQIGNATLTVELEDNEAGRALAALLADGPRTISASNYGGFEKVCPLGARLPASDTQTTTQPGDVMLYSGNQIVIFYGSNSWAYTRLGRVRNATAAELKAALSGPEDQITLSMK